MSAWLTWFAASFSILLAASTARADRIAMLALASPGHGEPVEDADRVAADLLAKGHRIVASADARIRLSSGDAGAGPDWSAQTVQSLGAARSALTRLDRSFATTVVRRARDDIARQGGGAGGAQVLVEWALMERALSRTAGDERAAAGWLDAAATLGPDVALDPVTHPTDERDPFAHRVATLRQELSSKIDVGSTPSGADVWADGTRRCNTPCSVTFLPGRHFVRISTPAHTPAVFAIDLGPGVSASRTLGLSSAYAGASLPAVSAMLADPSRRAEAASAIEPMARFLDVDHVIAIVPEADGALRIIVAPPVLGRSRIGPAVLPSSLAPSVIEQLTPLESPASSSASGGPEGTAWYKKPGYWLVGAGVIGGVLAGVLIIDNNRAPTSGSLVVRSP